MSTRGAGAAGGANASVLGNRRYRYVNSRGGNDVTSGQLANLQSLIDALHEVNPRITDGKPFVARLTRPGTDWDDDNDPISADNGPVLEYVPEKIGVSGMEHDILCTVYTCQKYRGVIVFDHGNAVGPPFGPASDPLAYNNKNDGIIAGITQNERIDLIRDAYWEVHNLGFATAPVQAAIMQHMVYCAGLGPNGHVIASKTFRDWRLAQPAVFQRAAP